MRLTKLIAITLIGLFCAMPAWAGITTRDAKALRERVAAIYADKTIAQYILTVDDSLLDRAWLKTILELAQKPDARLFFMAFGTETDYNNENETKIRNAYLNYNALTLKQMPDNLNQLDVVLDGSNSWTTKHVYSVYAGNDNDLWCVEKNFRYEDEMDFWQRYRIRILRLKKGVLQNLTPNDFNRNDFFDEPNPKMSKIDASWPVEEFFYDCDNVIDFAVDTSKVPFKLKARLNYVYHYEGKYKNRVWDECRPDYEIEYTWNGEKYVRGEKIYQNNDDMPELRKKVAAMFTNPKAIDQILNSETIDYNWLSLMLKHVESPDARLFFLAAGVHNSIPGYAAGGLQPSYLESEEWNTPTSSYMDIIRNMGSGGYGNDVLFETVTAADGSIWCAVTNVFYEKALPFSQHTYILRFADGKFYDLTPDSNIDDAEFYESGQIEFPPNPYQGVLATVLLEECCMYTVFEVDKSTVPFKLKAFSKEASESWYGNHNTQCYTCVPQCYLEFEWDGAKYVQTGKVCNQDGWGIFVPELN